MLTLALVTFVLVPQEPTIQTKVKAMTARIAPARLEETVRALVACQSRHVLAASKSQALDWLQGQLEECVARSKGRLTIQRESHDVLAQRLGRMVTCTNLIARLPGTSDAARLYVLGGHFDSINSDNRDATNAAPGANDDGSGTAAVLEACRAMCTESFPATIEFCFFDAEEMGLLGSTAHAEALAKAGAQIDGMITNDICGNTLGMDGKRHDRYMRCFSYAPRGNDSPGRSFARAASYAQRMHVPDLELRLVFRGDRFGRGGDHKPFANLGFPALRFSEAREDFSRQHQNVTERDGKPYGDLPEFVDYAYLARLAAIDVATLAELASAPLPPSNVRVQGSRTSNDTHVTWTAAAGASGYEVLWRLTTAPEWEGAQVVPGGTGRLAFTWKDVCVDDVVIGVRSLAQGGARSRASTPAEPDAFDQRPTSRPSTSRGGDR